MQRQSQSSDVYPNALFGSVRDVAEAPVPNPLYRNASGDAEDRKDNKGGQV